MNCRKSQYGRDTQNLTQMRPRRRGQAVGGNDGDDLMAFSKPSRGWQCKNDGSEEGERHDLGHRQPNDLRFQVLARLALSAALL